MLVIISDLHFCDRTAMERNYDPADFRSLMQDVYELAGDYLVDSGERRQIDIVLLGDIFDLLRTERWFEVPVAERPWGSAAVLDTPEPGPGALRQARAITREIIERNADILPILRGEGLAPPDNCCIRRLYLPGNHDRLYLHDPEIRGLMQQALGAVDAASDPGLAREGIFAHRLVLPRYGVLCRHGHEWDEWNFERFRPDRVPSQYSDEEYLFTPIGDLITTELVARLPYELRLRLRASPAFNEQEVDSVCARMQAIEDVRPLMAAFYWISYEAQNLHGMLPPDQARALQDALSDAILQIGRDFQALDFYRAWHARHDRLARIDNADLLQAVLTVCTQFHWVKLQELAWIFSAADSTLDLFTSDPVRAGAAREDLGAFADNALRFVVYGHTHEPLQQALRAQRGTEDMYLNSGTWRRRQHATLDKTGFIGWQHFSYIFFYDEDELLANRRRNPTSPRDRRGTGYEFWAGTRARGTPQ